MQPPCHKQKLDKLLKIAVICYVNGRLSTGVAETHGLSILQGHYIAALVSNNKAQFIQKQLIRGEIP